MNTVMTVLGPVDASELGVTLPHEHLLLDLSVLWHQPRDESRAPLVDAPLTPETRALLLCDPYHSRPNMLLDDMDLAVEEIGRFRDLGGRTVVDLSTRTIGPYPNELAAIARRTGLNIIMGSGYYVRPAHPDWLAAASIDDLAVRIVGELTDGFGDTGVRAGIIGEIGTRTPIHPDEEKALRAAARAHHATGAAINVHLAIFGREGHRVLDVLESERVDPRRVALSHLDERPDFTYHRELAQRGAYIEFDCFGSECYWDEDDTREASDAERIEALLKLLDAGFAGQMLLSHDVCTKVQLRRYGGTGYDHLLRAIVPRLRRRGVDEATLQTILVQNPACLLAGS
jgi:phosphotriesterase-related protein